MVLMWERKSTACEKKLSYVPLRAPIPVRVPTVCMLKLVLVTKALGQEANMMSQTCLQQQQFHQNVDSVSPCIIRPVTVVGYPKILSQSTTCLRNRFA